MTELLPDGHFFAGLRRNAYRVIYADPPWRFSAGGKRNPEAHYKTMSIRDIAALPVADLAHPEGCRLLMWATAPILLLPFGPREVMTAWGFRYSTSRVWRKLWPREDALFHYHDSQARGTGFEATGDWEILIVAKRGKVESLKGRVPRGLVSARRREHSRKPDLFRDEIHRLLQGPRLELFCRHEHDGWDVWGDEVTKFGRSSERIERSQDERDAHNEGAADESYPYRAPDRKGDGLPHIILP